MSRVPVIEVFHLPSAASFYAAIVQPLGIYYLSSSPPPLPTSSASSTISIPRAPTLNFGLPGTPSCPPEILFTLRESPNPVRSILTIDAFSPAAITAFHARALAANNIRSTNVIQHNPEESIAKTTDLDGNMVEAKYNSRRSSGGAKIWETAATPKEARRVLDWQKDVARSVTASDPSDEGDDAASVVSASRPLPSRRETDPARPTRRETISTYQYQPREPARAERLVGGMSNQALIGTILGAAAGAAVAYAMVRSESPEPPPPATSIDRRNSMPPTAPPMRLIRYHSAPSKVVQVESVRSAKGSRSGGSDAGSVRSGRSGSGVGQVVRYHVRGGEPDLDDIDEERSMHHRSRAEKESIIAQEEKAATVVSRSSRHSVSSNNRGHRNRDQERESTVLPPLPESRATSVVSRSHDGGENKSKSGSKSGRSHVSERSSASTVKPKAKSHASTTLTINSRSGERKSTVSAKNVPLPESVVSGARSNATARMVPLPESVVSSPRSVARSVAPSDSISNVGSRRERW